MGQPIKTTRNCEVVGVGLACDRLVINYKLKMYLL